jgi:hypothetical protein
MPGARNIREAVDWADVYADVAELVIGKSSENYTVNEQYLHRVSRGVYQLDPAFLL